MYLFRGDIGALLILFSLPFSFFLVFSKALGIFLVLLANLFAAHDGLEALFIASSGPRKLQITNTSNKQTCLGLC